MESSHCYSGGHGRATLDQEARDVKIPISCSAASAIQGSLILVDLAVDIFTSLD